MDDCLNRSDSATFISKLDLLKVHWQVPLSDRAREISAFAIPDGLFQCNVMPFGIRNVPATFRRMIGKVVSGLSGCGVYTGDTIVLVMFW